MAAAEFKAKCLRVMDGVQRTRQPVLITKKGKPVARLVPVDAEAPDVFGCLSTEMTIVGDVVRPVNAPEDWESA